jgi:flagellar assembly protein FliH
MSSRLYLPDEGKVPEPLLLRPAGAAAAKTEEPRIDQTAEWRAECDRRVAEARAAAFAEGEAAAAASAGEELRRAAEQAARSLAEIASLRHRLRREAEGDLVRLSLAIARRILHRELAVDPEALRGIVLAALEQLQAQEISRALVHPGQASLVRECLERLAAARVEVVPDASLAPGAVVFQTARGNLDASVETQLQEIGRGLADRLVGAGS